MSLVLVIALDSAFSIVRSPAEVEADREAELELPKSGFTIFGSTVELLDEVPLLFPKLNAPNADV